MQSERDPRIDPRRGDELQGTTRRYVGTVTDVEIGFTYWRLRGGRFNGGAGNDCYTSFAKWRKWAKNAEVIRRGDEKGASDAKD